MRWSGIALLASVISLAACGGTPAASESLTRSVVADVILSVTNHTPKRMIIYLRSAAVEDSLGVVAERSSRSFTLPSGRSETDSLHFEARPSGAATGIRSGAFAVAAGQQVLWTFDERGSKQVMTR